MGSKKSCFQKKVQMGKILGQRKMLCQKEFLVEEDLSLKFSAWKSFVLVSFP